MNKFAKGDCFFLTCLYEPEKDMAVTVNPIRFTNKAKWDKRDKKLDMHFDKLERLYAHGVKFLNHGAGGFEQIEIRIDAIGSSCDNCDNYTSYICNAVKPEERAETYPYDGFVFSGAVLSAAERTIYDHTLKNADVRQITGMSFYKARELMREYGYKVGGHWAMSERTLARLIDTGCVKRS